MMLQVRLTYTCQRCRGTGIESDPEQFGYAQLYDRAREASGAGGPGSIVDIYNRLCEQRLAELELAEYPPEEGTCQQCDGTGRLTDLFSEQDLVAAIEARDRAALDPRAARHWTLTPARPR